MIRVPTPPRADWPTIVESQGLTYHSLDDEPYWDESAYYLLESHEVDAIEQATLALDAMTLEAVEHVVAEGRLGEIGIPDHCHAWIERSWEVDERTVYGRFDLAYDGQGPPKLLEFNADTPTSLLEAAVIQWAWAGALLGPLGGLHQSGFDQYSSIHEQLIEAWRLVGKTLGPRVTFAGLPESAEDTMTIAYLRDVATQAGLATQQIAMKSIGWHAGRSTFTDLRERPIEVLFKLYPWEWIIREPFAQYLDRAPTRWLEPPWKMVLSNKAILPILHELFPDSPYILRAEFAPFGSTYVAKPIYSREGANVTIVDRGRTIAESDGDYDAEPRIYQAYQPLPQFDGRSMVVGSWLVNGHACGIGLREDDSPITRNTSRFVPHLFRKAARLKPPIMQPNTATRSVGSDRTGQGPADPLWDRWVDG